MPNLLLTLRHNINLESDVELARADVSALCGVLTRDVKTFTSAADLHHWITAQNNWLEDTENTFIKRALRQSGTVALLIEDAALHQFEQVIERAAFIQEAVLVDSPSLLGDSTILKRLARVHAIDEGRYVTRGVSLAAILEYSTPLVFRRDRIGSVSVALDNLVELLLDGSPPCCNLETHLNHAVAAKKSTLYLSHELHLYKGKFFPRLVHSLINRFLPQTTGGLVCDPFAGSGTALLEAALLGFDSVGIDVDPTSVLISEHKTILASIDPDELQEICAAMETAVEGKQASLFFANRAYDLATWRQHLVQVPEPMRHRLTKRGNEEGYDLLGEIEQDSAIALSLIAQVPAHLQSLFKVCLSHALTKKIRLRFVGIGNGRFTFDVAKVRVLELFLKKSYHMLAISEAFTWLKRCGVHLGNVEVHRNSATNITDVFPPNSIDLVLTSPPYIPASSGREHYARARAIPLVLTGAASVDELEELDNSFIGEMNGHGEDDTDVQMMPEAVRRTLTFLSNDTQRRPKYMPTLQYYRDIRRVLEGVNTTLTEDGFALFVVADSHTFYIHKTKEILHTVDATNAICEVGQQAGLHVTDVLGVPLMKSGGLNARPRSTDDYSEAVVVFRKGANG
jgi:hypothetical protein